MQKKSVFATKNMKTFQAADEIFYSTEVIISAFVFLA
jgi:hypothetical protein